MTKPSLASKINKKGGLPITNESRVDVTWEELKAELDIQGEIRDVTLMKPKKIRIWLQPKKQKTEEKEV